MIDQLADNPPARFGQDLLHINPSSQSLRHFIPLIEQKAVKRDRFGNRMISSTSKAYYDREGVETKASMLISPDGEKFIKKNNGILNDIDEGLKKLNWETNDTTRIVELGSGRRMGYLKAVGYFSGKPRQIRGGSQSEIYLLEVDSEKFLIKKTTTDNRQKVNQPYINEMLQSQALATDLKSEFDEVRAEMPKFLFATGQVACRKFEEGTEIEYNEFDSGIQKLAPKITQYIKEQQQKGVTLWNNIKQDIYTSFPPHSTIIPQLNSWIKKADGKFVCIDPFFYDKK